MPYVNYVRGSLSKLPEEIVDGSIYYLRNGGIYTDQGTTRVHHNPPADWNATDRNSPAYIDNKPELGSVSSHDVLDSETDLNQTSDIPTSKHVYKSVYALTVEVETLKGALGRPEVVDGVADMTDTKKAYVYVGEEENMNKGHWYYFDAIEEKWTDGGSYFSGVETDVTLTRGGISADAAAVGNRLTELMGQIEEMLKTQNVLTAFVDSQEVLNESFADDLEVTEEGLVYILNNGTRIGGPYGPFAGNGSGGGGGGGGDIIDAKFNATKVSDWATKTISDSGDASFEFTWESLENDLPSGRGTVTITVNNIVKGTISVNQGDISLSLKPYLSSGANKIRIRIADQYDQGKIWTVNVEVISLKIESLFDTSFPFTEAINFTYTPYGAVTKTVHFSLDGTEIGTTTTPVTGHQLSYAIPKQSHGSHTLDVYFEAEINGEQVTSNTLHYEFISLDENGTRTIISSSFTTTSVDQYTSVVIPFVVYTPKSLESIVELYANDVLVSSQTVDRSQHSYTYKANTPGQIEFKIVSGEETRILTFTVNESDINVEAETDALALYLFAEGRSNGEDASQRSVWKYNDIEAQLTGFSWNMLDGWQKGEDNATVLRLVRDARVVIPYKLFGTDFKSTGKTIEIEFETNNVIDYSVPIISCKQDGVGLEITPQTVTFNGAQTELMTPFKENEHIRLSIVVEKQTEYRLLYFYINGIMSSAIQYASGERFTQLQPVDITIGSNLCGLDIYSIRVYDNNLTRQQIVNNWIADTTDGTLMLERYNHNDIYDAYGDISPSTLPIDLPYFIIYADEMPQYKGDKKTVYGSYTDPSNPSQSFEFEGCQANVQGTSSEGYFRKNYDLQFKKGFDFTSGHKDKISIISAKPFNRFVLKADVASSESANNTLLCMFYNDTCPYKIPEMIQDPQIRWGIEGKPAVLFWNDTKTGTLNFLSMILVLAQVKPTLIYGETPEMDNAYERYYYLRTTTKRVGAERSCNSLNCNYNLKKKLQKRGQR